MAAEFAVVSDPVGFECAAAPAPRFPACYSRAFPKHNADGILAFVPNRFSATRAVFGSTNGISELGNKFLILPAVVTGVSLCPKGRVGDYKCHPRGWFEFCIHGKCFS